MNKLYADGAFCRHTGICGIGVYAGNGLKDWHEFSCYEKASSSLEAEIRSIEIAILRAIEFGLREITVYNDCQEAVDRVNENRLSEYPQFDFTQYASMFEHLEIKKVHRDNNIAHTYSKEGLEAGRIHKKISSD